MNNDDDTKTLENFQRWDVKGLKQFLRKRNQPLTGNKAVLVARCFSAQQLGIPVSLTPTEKRQMLDIQYQNLLITDDEGRLPDPFYELETDWKTETESMSSWPPTLIQDISVYLSKHDTVTDKVSLSKRLLCDYKEQKAYSYFTSKFIFEVMYHNIKLESAYCFMKCKCQPSQRVTDVAHDVWVLLRKHTGDIVCAYCTCFAGLGQTCNHVAALLFRVDYAWKTGECQLACTSQPCAWNSSRKAIEPILVSDMNIVKPKALLHQPTSTRTLNCAAKQLFVPHKPKEGMTEQEFLAKLNDFSPSSVTLAERDVGRRDIHVRYDAELTSTDDVSVCTSIENLAAAAKSVDDFQQTIASLSYTQEDIDNIEQQTRNQNTETWKLQRRGRLTASKFHRIYTRMRTYCTDPSTDMTSVISETLQYVTPPETIRHLKYGLRLESTARRAYESMLKRTGHKDVKITLCGLLVDKDLPYIGASPDGIVECSCCSKRLLEIKCPTSCMHASPNETNVECLQVRDGATLLKKQHKYYTQITGQMAVSGLSVCDFFVYSDMGYHYEQLTLDFDFWCSVQQMLETFFVTFIGPELVTRAIQKQIEIKQPVRHATKTETKQTRVKQPRSKAQGQKKRVARKPRQDERPVYMCDVCLQPCEDVSVLDDDFSKFSIACDVCKRWLHWSCVGIKSKNDPLLQSDEYVCADCTSLKLDLDVMSFDCQ